MEPATAHPEPVHVEARNDRVDEQQEQPVDDEQEEPQRDHRDRQGEDHEQRADDGVHEAEDERRGKGGHHAVDLDDARKQVADQEHRDGAGAHTDEERHGGHLLFRCSPSFHSAASGARRFPQRTIISSNECLGELRELER